MPARHSAFLFAVLIRFPFFLCLFSRFLVHFLHTCYWSGICSFWLRAHCSINLSRSVIVFNVTIPLPSSRTKRVHPYFVWECEVLACAHWSIWLAPGPGAGLLSLCSSHISHIQAPIFHCIWHLNFLFSVIDIFRRRQSLFIMLRDAHLVVSLQTVFMGHCLLFCTLCTLNHVPLLV